MFYLRTRPTPNAATQNMFCSFDTIFPINLGQYYPAPSVYIDTMNIVKIFLFIYYYVWELYYRYKSFRGMYIKHKIFFERPL